MTVPLYRSDSGLKKKKDSWGHHSTNAVNSLNFFFHSVKALNMGEGREITLSLKMTQDARVTHTPHNAAGALPERCPFGCPLKKNQ